MDDGEFYYVEFVLVYVKGYYLMFVLGLMWNKINCCIYDFLECCGMYLKCLGGYLIVVQVNVCFEMLFVFD